VITVAVEGDTDVPFVTRLCEATGFTVRTPLVAAGGKHTLDPLIAGFARSAQWAPHLVVRDLDRDAPCAGAWIETNGPATSATFFALRLAVRAVEAWFLADRAVAAAALHVDEGRIPRLPDDEADPKLTIVNLARASSKPWVRAAIVPAQGMSRKAAAGYGGWLLGASARWSVERAMANSASLARAYRRLTELHKAWAASQA
jgi:hypothetical protein